jgi:uncharacterized delta-60 repeat protein
VVIKHVHTKETAMSTRLTVLASLLCLSFAAAAAEGDLDPSYGVDGAVIIPFNIVPGGNDQAFALEVLPDGRALLAGFTQVPLAGGMDTQYEQVVARINANGSGFDPSFGVGGVRRVSFGNTQFQNVARRMQVLADGRVLVAGEVDASATSTFEPDMSIFRLTAAGNLDTGFDLDGRLQISLFGQDGVEDLDVYADGRILLSGYSAPSGSTNACGVLLRLNPDGSSDSTFGTGGGRCFQPPAGPEPLTFVTGTEILDDGRLIATGIVNTGSGSPLANVDMFASGLLADGSDDPAYGSGGYTVLAFDQGGDNADFSLSSVRQPDGSVLLAGRAEGAGGFDIAVARLLADGSADASFGTGGRVLIPIDLLPGGNDGARAIALQDDGRIVLAGDAQREPGGNSAAVILRLLPDGSLDTSFGSNGVVLVAPVVFGNDNDSATFEAVTIANGQIHAAGRVRGLFGSGTVDFDMLVVRLVGVDIFSDGFESP